MPPGSLFSAADFDLESAEVWPENWAAWSLFCEMSGQWRRGPNGEPLALDYGPLFSRMEHMRLNEEDWNDLFADVRVIERAALEQIDNNEPA